MSSYTLPIGPVHVVLEEPIYFKLRVEGETVVGLDINAGHVHRGIEFLDFMTNAFPAVQGEWFQAALELKTGNEMIGDVGFIIKKDDGRQAYVGYSLARAHWGSGYAYEAVTCLLAYLFDELNLHRVVAECDVENTASWKLLEKLGFRRESHLIENIFFKGAYGSEYHYAMLGGEWKERYLAQRDETEVA